MPSLPNWLAAFCSVASLVVIVVGAIQVEDFALRMQAQLDAVLETSSASAAPMRMVFTWTTEDGTQQLETPREPGETFPDLWERHKLYIRLALEEE
jgi:hypothetical protein